MDITHVIHDAKSNDLLVALNDTLMQLGVQLRRDGYNHNITINNPNHLQSSESNIVQTHAGPLLTPQPSKKKRRLNPTATLHEFLDSIQKETFLLRDANLISNQDLRRAAFPTSGAGRREHEPRRRVDVQGRNDARSGRSGNDKEGHRRAPESRCFSKVVEAENVV
jgi:hypothetical protein